MTRRSPITLKARLDWGGYISIIDPAVPDLDGDVARHTRLSRSEIPRIS
ncbi:MAG: hypothetical protein IT305_13420 [Chloroflexi bacterium]|nr:hypothetical protein [Chloroflexota bacterium]